MSIQNPGFSYRLGLGPGSASVDFTQSPERQLKRLAIAQASQKAFQETRRQLTEAGRKQVSGTSRAPLLADLAGRLATLSSNLATPRALASAGPLNLGAGNGNDETRIDPNAPLNTQSFGLAITAGTVNVTLQVNGGASTTQTVTIDPNQSLNANLQAFSDLTVGGVKPLTASFQDGQALFQVASTSGSTFNVSITAGTSNFFEAVTNGGRVTDQTFTGNASVGSAPGTAFADLSVSYGGKTAAITNLTTSSSGLSPYQRATQLASKINDALAAQGIAEQGLVATALANGQIQFADHNGAAPLNPALGLSVTESGAGQTLGFAGGFTAQTTLSGGPDLEGPDATLAQLAGRLGLTADNGAFTGTINGVQFHFDQTQTLSSALNDITASAAGVNATYDPDARKVTLTQKTAGPAPIDVQDTGGNFFAALRLAPAAGATTADTAAGAIANLREIGQALGDTLGLVESAIGRGGAFRGNLLLKDLADAIGAQFKTSADGGLHTLADFGITRKDGQVEVDQQRVNDLLANSPDKVLQAANALVQQQVAPLAQAGQQALEDELARTPLELRLAQQNVHARAEIARLQDRQNLLIHQEAALDRANRAVAAQTKGLDEAKKRLEAESVHVPPQHGDLFKPIGHENDHFPPAPIADRSALAAPQPAQPAPQPGAAPSALLSFGLGTTNT